MRSMERSRHWRWAGRTTPTRMAGGSPLRRSINMRRRWRLGLESARRTCRPFSRTWRIFRPAIWGSWASRMIYFQPSGDRFLDGDGKGSYECVAWTREARSGRRPMRTMLKLWLLLVTLGLAPQGRGQGPVLAGVAPVLEGGIGFSYVKSDVPSQGNMAMNGVLVSGREDLNAYLGAKLEVGDSRSFDAFQTGRRADILTYMGGPVFYPVRRRKFSIYAQVLLGGARETGVNFERDRKSTRLNSSHSQISYAVFCLKKKKTHAIATTRCPRLNSWDTHHIRTL